ncbi:MAG: peroxidase [Caldithrix sp.]|nr:peroxidase [Caldithrix sp.]
MLQKLIDDYKEAAIDPADRAMLDYAVKLTLNIGDMQQTDVQSLYSAGFTDRAIHDICVITAYFGFVNRIAEGLGVEMEDEETT